MFLGQVTEVANKPFAHDQRVFQQSLVLDDTHVLKRGRRTRGATSESRDVPEIVQRILGIVLEQFKHRLGGHQTRNRGVAACDALGHGHHIGLDTVVLIAEPLARPAHAADDLVYMEQNVMPAADFLNPVPVSIGWGDDTSPRRDRLQTECADGIGSLSQNHVLDESSSVFAIGFGRRIPAILGTVFKTVRNPDEAGSERAILRVSLILTSGAKGADRGSVVVPVAVKDLELTATVTFVGDLTNHLERLLIRLRTGIRIVNAAHSRHSGNQLFREQRARHRAGRTREIVELQELLVDGPGDRFAAVPHINRPYATGQGIEVLLSAGVPYPKSLPLDNDARIGELERLVLGQVVPDMSAVGLDHVGNVVFRELKVHGPNSLCRPDFGGRVKIPDCIDTTENASGIEPDISGP